MLMATLLFRPAVAKADAVLDWNLIAVNTTAPSGPFAQARYVAIVQLAVFEAVNSITRDYRPYLGSIVAPHGASADAAAIQAAFRVLSTYFPASASMLGTARANSLALIPDGQPKSDGSDGRRRSSCHDRSSPTMARRRRNSRYRRRGSRPIRPRRVANREWKRCRVFFQWGT
jgi:hypothetical protein